MLRTFINGTVKISDTLVQPIENTLAIQTKLLDGKNNYMPRNDLQSHVMTLYDDIILSMFSNPQFAGVVCTLLPGTSAYAHETSLMSTRAHSLKREGFSGVETAYILSFY